jgi:tungstate transport system ATP-binding protein
MKPLFAVRGLRKAYAGRTVLNVDTLELQAGQSYALTGDNGSGKSTLLRALAGLEPAASSFCEFHGTAFSLQAYPEDLRHEIVYVHQHPYLFKTSIVDNIAYGLKARGIDGAERARRVEEAMAWAGVEHLRGVPPQKLSGGEKQRVALARARVLKPRLFLLDEPTANLDDVAVRQVIELIRKLCEDNNGVLVACHDREIIELPAIRRLHLEAGRLGPAPDTRL